MICSSLPGWNAWGAAAASAPVAPAKLIENARAKTDFVTNVSSYRSREQPLNLTSPLWGGRTAVARQREAVRVGGILPRAIPCAILALSETTGKSKACEFRRT